MILHHHRWSLPITLNRVTCQRCLECGLRRLFDPLRWRPGKRLRADPARPRSPAPAAWFAPPLAGSRGPRPPASAA